MTKISRRKDVAEMQKDPQESPKSVTVEPCDRAAQTEELIRLLDESNAAQDALLAEVNMVTDRIIERDKIIAQLRIELMATQDSVTSLKADDTAIRELQAKLEQAQSDIVARDKELRELRDSHSQDIDGLVRLHRSSTSWRVSAPVRALGRLLKRGS